MTAETQRQNAKPESWKGLLDLQFIFKRHQGLAMLGL